MRQERWQCLYCEAQNNLNAESCSGCGRSCYEVSDSDMQAEREALYAPPRRRDGSNVIHWKELLMWMLGLPIGLFNAFDTLTSDHVTGAICSRSHQCTHWEVHGSLPIFLLALSWLAIAVVAISVLLDHYDRNVQTEPLYHRIKYIGLTLYFGLTLASMLVGAWRGLVFEVLS
ncbi:MAG: hypothetical protein AAGC84_12300, partial [Pseudomonas sp.]